MGQRVDNFRSVMQDSKSRAIVIVVFVMLIFTISIGYLKLKRLGGQTGPVAIADVSGTPSISSIPGIAEPSREYAKLQEIQNNQLAKEAAKKGTSAIPTVIRTTYLDSGVAEDLGVRSAAASTTGCNTEELMRARVAGVTAMELRCRGCSLAALKTAGFSAAELRSAGFGDQELKAAGFSADELKAAGAGAKDLIAAGFMPQTLKIAGFTAGELKEAGLNDQELKKANYSDSDIKNAGFNTPVILSAYDCSIEKLTDAHNRGVSAAQLKKMGCSAGALKTAGFSAKELRDAGFSARELKDAGFSAKELKDAGFSAGELHGAGFSAQELKDAGFSAKELKDAGFSAGDLLKAGFTPEDLKKVGFTDGDLIRAGVDLKQVKAVNNTDVAPTIANSEITKLPAGGGVSSPGANASSNQNQVASVAQAPGANMADWQKQIEQMRKQQSQQLSTQQSQEKIKEMQTMMSGQANDLFASWTPLPQQQFVLGNLDKPVTGEATNQSKGGDRASAANTNLSVNLNATTYKAGTILFAVLDTGINTDENSPIMATIVEGDLKGAKVLGTFERANKKVVLKFNTFNIPSLKNSIAANSVAIDANTARTAMAAHVNSHYLLRYGTFFAASFISGLGQAIQNSGSSSTTSDTGQKQQFWPKLNAGQEALVAIGNVGQQFSNKLSPVLETPPTVEVRAGTGIGLLLMSDLSIPKSN